jgi:hypothetical protein
MPFAECTNVDRDRIDGYTVGMSRTKAFEELGRAQRAGLIHSQPAAATAASREGVTDDERSRFTYYDETRRYRARFGGPGDGLMDLLLSRNTVDSRRWSRVDDVSGSSPSLAALPREAAMVLQLVRHMQYQDGGGRCS